MPDLTESELRELDLWVAEAANVQVEDGMFGELRVVDWEEVPELWHPTHSFDQAWEHLAERLKDCEIRITREAGRPVIGRIFKPRVVMPGYAEHLDGPALAFCLAAYSAITGKPFKAVSEKDEA